METIGVVATVAFALLGVLLFIIVPLWWAGHEKYRITPSHVEMLLPWPLPTRRFRLVELEGARIVDRGPGLRRCLWFNLRLAIRVWEFVLGRFENWGWNLCGRAVLISRTGGRSVLVTPSEPDRFIQELTDAIAHVRRDAES